MILDTNALSAMADGNTNLEPAVANASRLAIPVIVLGEYQFGIMGSRNQRHYERWLETTVRNCTVLSIDEGTASEYAKLRDELRLKGRTIPTNDAWIAALARQHSLCVVSRDAHFDAVPRLKRLIW